METRTMNNIAELADCLGVDPASSDEETARRISRRVYRATECGAWLALTSKCGPPVQRRYVVRFSDTILGPCVNGWRCWGEQGLRLMTDAPPALLEYLDPFNERKRPEIIPLPADMGRTMTDARRAIDSNTGDELRWLDRPVLGPYTAKITLSEPGEPRPAVAIGSIVEGSDAEVPPEILPFPFTLADYERAIENVEEEADRLWHEANC